MPLLSESPHVLPIHRKILGFSLVTATLFGQAQTADTQLVSTSNVSTITLRFIAFCS